MPVLLPPPSHAQSASTAVVRYSLEQSWPAQGDEGRAVDARIQEVFRDLRDRTSSDLRVSEEVSDSYRHVPLKSVGTIRVRYKAAVPLRPRQFDFDDEDE